MDPNPPNQNEAPDADHADWELLASYVSGRATTSERASVERRLRDEPAFRALMREAEIAWSYGAEAHGVDATPDDARRVWLGLVARIRAAEGLDVFAAPGSAGRTGIRSPTPVRTRAWPRRVRSGAGLLALAASVALAIGGAVFWQGLGPASRTVVAAGPVQEIVAPAGSIASLRLADGTLVRLAPGSRLRAPSPFGSGERAVSLEGRAYFDVAHDADRPFIVRASGTATRVLGTRFEVRAYPQDPEVAVTVESGRVSIRPGPERGAPAGEAQVLAAGDVGVIDGDGSIRIRHDANVRALLAWTGGQLVFDETPLEEVAAELERWAPIEIEVAPPLAGLRLTATFEGEPIDTIVEIVARLLDVRLEREGARYRIVPH